MGRGIIQLGDPENHHKAHWKNSYKLRKGEAKVIDKMMCEAWKSGTSNPAQKTDVCDTLRHYNCFGVRNFGKSIFELPLKGNRLLDQNDVDLILHGPFDVSPIDFATGNG